MHRAVKFASALLGAVLAFEVVNTVGAVAATDNYAAASAHSPLGQTRLVPAGRIGSTVAIKGVAGAKAAVTLLKVVDPARATGQFITQPSGSRFVGLEFRLVSKAPASSPEPTVSWTSR